MATLRASEISYDSRLRLIAIESVDFRSSNTGTLCQVFAKIEPIALVVCGRDAAYALDMEARPAVLEHLRRDVPGLDAMLRGYKESGHNHS